MAATAAATLATTAATLATAAGLYALHRLGPEGRRFAASLTAGALVQLAADLTHAIRRQR